MHWLHRSGVLPISRLGPVDCKTLVYIDANFFVPANTGDGSVMIEDA